MIKYDAEKLFEVAKGDYWMTKDNLRILVDVNNNTGLFINKLTATYGSTVWSEFANCIQDFSEKGYIKHQWDLIAIQPKWKEYLFNLDCLSKRKWYEKLRDWWNWNNVKGYGNLIATILSIVAIIISGLSLFIKWHYNDFRECPKFEEWTKN